jgi:hypothetical protein
MVHKSVITLLNLSLSDSLMTAPNDQAVAKTKKYYTLLESNWVNSVGRENYK